MTTDDAVYIIAHRQGLRLEKYLDKLTLDRVRDLVPRAQAPAVRANSVSRTRKSRRNASPDPDTRFPLVGERLTRVARELGSEVYPTVFLIENSIRNLVRKVLGETKTWWAEKAPPGVRNNVEQTMRKEEKYPYRKKRGVDQLEYANWNDLKEIILRNGKSFEPVLQHMEWFSVHMREVYMARNNLAHSVPLTKADINRIKLFAEDWANMMGRAGFE
jgi:hypothetical protein